MMLMKTQNIRLEIANETHLNRIATLVNSAYRGESGKVGWTTEADFLDGQRTDQEALQVLLEKQDSLILIAHSSVTDAVDDILGCVHLERRGEKCYLGMLTTRPNLQGQGLGKFLIQASVKQAQAMGCQRIEITVIAGRHELIAWYEKIGFQKTGETRPFPCGNPRFGIPKVANLYFDVLVKPL
jgi:ribosomal protein S18 acetylase RimI-like enzyme